MRVWARAQAQVQVQVWVWVQVRVWASVQLLGVAVVHWTVDAHVEAFQFVSERRLPRRAAGMGAGAGAGTGAGAGAGAGARGAWISMSC